jgi:fused signal recognition particle receptor
VFNWFRRQFGDDKQNSQVEQEETTQEQPQVEPAEAEEEADASPAVAEDYLSWAKNAYKNIQQRQQPPAEADTATAEPTTEFEVEAAEGSAQEEAAVTAAVETTTAPSAPEAALDDDQEEPAVAEVTETPEESAQEEASVTAAAETTAPSAPEAALDDDQEERAVAEVTETPEESAPVAPTVAEKETQETEASPEPVATAPETQESDTGVTEDAIAAAQAEESPAGNVPIWARQSNADRQARLERLKATAIDTSEPEPVRAPVQPVDATVATETEGETGIAFDEGFLWSAEVLAAQGRRPEDVSIEEISWLKRLRQGLDKTRRSLINQLKAIVGQGPLNQDAVMEIEALLLQADVGVEATDYIITTLQSRLREETLPPEQAIAYLKQILRDLLDRPLKESYSATFTPEKDTLNVWLITGVNGAGKTTTIGKLSHLANQSGYRCLIGAADTFRAAAVEQVKVWGQRSGTDVIANPAKNTDPASVVFDAIAAAQARHTELLLIDTAGRLQNKKNLMEELGKIRRIIDKKAPDARVESLLVLDATLGQNGLRQAEVFAEVAKLSGVVLTKLDGTAKGGVALAVVQQLGLPIRFIGAGEGIEDLRPFSSYEFVEALLNG